MYHLIIMSELPLSILYVDDEPLLLNVTKEYLESLGFIVDIAASGIQALQKIQDGTFDAIVSDYQMPKMNGIELLKEIRSRNLDIPFILFTGRGREEVVIEAINNGADFYLQKGGKPAPQFTELTHKIKVAVQRRRDRRALCESELRFRSLIQNSSDIIRILSKDGIILFDSPSSSRILGYPEGSLIGSRAFDYIHPEDQVRVRGDFQDVWDECNTHVPTEYRICKADGTYLYVESIAINLAGVPGIDGIVTTTHSIQHQKTAEMEIRKMVDDLSAAYEKLSSYDEELKENYIELAQHEQALVKSEERFRGMTERSSDLILILDQGMSPTYVSPSAWSIIGYHPEELVGQPSEFAAATIFSQSGPIFLNGVQQSMKGDSIYNLEVQITKKDGTPVYVSLNAVPILYDGVFTGVQVSMRDITAVKNTEQALRETEERFSRFAANAQDVLYRISLPDVRYEYISPASIALTGYTPEEFYSDPGLFKTLVHPDWHPYFQEQRNALLSRNVPPTYEYQIVDRAGNIRWFNHRNVLVSNEHGDPVALEGIITDVTRQKNTEEELRKSEQRLLAVMMNAGSWIWEVDSDGIYRYCSPAVHDILGYSPDDLVGKVHFYDLFDPSVKDTLTSETMDAFSVHEPFKNFVNPNRHRDGSLVILNTSGTPVFDECGVFSGYCGVDQDITKEKEAEKKLIESEARYRLLADNVHDVIWTIDERMKPIYISPSIKGLQGFSPEEALTMSFHDSLTAESHKKLMQSHKGWMHTLQKGCSIPGKTVMELEFRCKDGSTVWTELMITPIYDANKKFSGVVGVTRDISLRRQGEERLRSANRQLNLLTSITRHDILNKISVIYTYLEVAEMKFSDPELLEYLRVMKVVTDEIQTQIEFTRVYEDLGAHEPQWVELNSVMPCSFLPPSITMRTDLEDISIFADSMLEKVFFNLLDNSLRHGQRVSEVQVSAYESDDDLIVLWQDNGMGIPTEEKEAIFERGYGNNTGLGMFLVREILSLTGISIRENGCFGEGVRFEIRVPKGAYTYGEDPANP
ncbi:MAG TPA: PAS domain S-box protein [Methanospirillum sp.]|nr:PAS domain S-box protein [Methanospirillum sp.]